MLYIAGFSCFRTEGPFTKSTTTKRTEQLNKFNMDEGLNIYPYTYGPDPFLVTRPLQAYGNALKTIYCMPCKQRHGLERYHHHHSTAYFNQHQSRFGSDVNCPTCKIRHPIQNPAEKRIILFTSSTLHNVYLDEQVRFPSHIDIESISGGQINDLYQAWKACYFDKQPQHVVIVAGLNNVERTSLEVFENTLNKWNFDVLNLNPDNTFRVCKLLKPPKLAWLPGNGNPPTSTYVNYLDKIEEMNKTIHKINIYNGHSNVIGFGSEGIRASRKKDGSGKKMLMHIFSSWREHRDGREKCLHIADKGRVNMMKKLLRYIYANV